MKRLFTYVATALAIPALAGSAKLSSPSLGTFFELGSWVPRYVRSTSTPGSSDYTNGTRRIDSTAVAAVNAMFEAHCERSFYPCAERYNHWDTEEYGTTTIGPTLRFDLPYWDRPPFVYYPATNRIVRSRRLAEYTNFDALADSLRGGNLNDKFKFQRDFDLSRAFAWSSSAFDDLDDVVDFPTSGWVSDPFSVLSTDQFRHVCPTFNSLSAGGTNSINYTTEGSFTVEDYTYFNFKNYPLAEYLFLKAEFNETNLQHSAIVSAFGVNPTLDESVYDLIGSLYATNHLMGITNETRRLFTERHAAVDQVLGSLDRTYGFIQDNSSDINTYTYSRTQNYISPEVTVPVSGLSLGSGVSGLSFSPDGPLYESALTNGTGGAVSMYTIGVSEPTLSVGVSANCNGASVLYINKSEIESQLIIPSEPSDFEVSVDNCLAYISDQSIVYTMQYSTSAASHTMTLTYPIPSPGSVKISLSAQYVRSYQMMCNDRPTIGFVHPSNFTRVNSCALLSLLSFAVKFGSEQDPIGTDAHGFPSADYSSGWSGDWMSRYMFKKDEATSYQDVGNVYGDLFSLVKNQIKGSTYGDSPEEIIPIRQTDIARFLEDANIPQHTRLVASVVFRFNPGTLTGTIDSSGQPVISNVPSRIELVDVAFNLPAGSVQTDSDMIDTVITHGYVAEGKVSVITQTDYNWNALRLHKQSSSNQ